jgi:glutaredoxin 3
MPKVTVYTSDACPYCVRAKRLLDAKGVDYEQIHLALWDAEARVRLTELTGRRTVPQILVEDTPLGGYDDIKALDDAGRLDDLLGVASA